MGRGVDVPLGPMLAIWFKLGRVDTAPAPCLPFGLS